MAQSNEQGDAELRRFIVQEIAHMTAKGIKSGVFEDWTVANKIADKVLIDRKQHELELLDRLEPLTHEGRGTIAWEMDNMLSAIKAERKKLGGSDGTK